VGRKSLATAQIVMTAERHPRLRGGGSEGTKIPAAVQAFGPQKNGYYFKFIRAVAQLGSALVSGTRGPGFKSRRPDNFPKEN
jgi:hypothetical protein